MKMTLAALWIGTLLTFWAAVFIIVGLPAFTLQDKPSKIWRPHTAREQAGHRLYVANGCSYCHTLFVRPIDWGLGSERIAESGDYYGYEAPILGTNRWGPDLSQQGGEHPDDWHMAHFVNPRNTSPQSVMPAWEFLGREQIALLTAYVQSQGGKLADQRVARQRSWGQQATVAYRAGIDENIRWLHAQVPGVWQPMPNPYAALTGNLKRGESIYQDFCINCHGNMGDGQGPAARYLLPPPLNFTTLRRHLVGQKYIGGLLYYQIMNGITGTAMPYFKRMLESDKIWAVSNYIAVYFIGYSDGDIAPKGIDAAYEPPYRNPFAPPSPTEGPVRQAPRAPEVP